MIGGIKISHRATVMREVVKVKPKWFEFVRVGTDNLKILTAILNMDSCSDMYSLNNVIIEMIDSTKLDYVWEGTVHQNVLKIGDKLNLESETVTIIDVELNVSGSVVYTVESVSVRCDNYDELLFECKSAFEYTKNRSYTEDIIDKSDEVEMKTKK